MFSDRYGPWALVAGGSDGIGAAFARELAARGLNLVLVARRPGTLEETAGALRAAHPALEIRTLSQDLASPDAAQRIAAATADLAIGCLVYNAGSESRYGDFLDHDWDFIAGRLQRNFVTKVALTHHFGRLMRPHGRGGIILMGSVAGYSGSPGFSLYGASKAFTFNLSEALWFELRRHGIDLLCPVVGPTNTPTMINSYGPIEGHATDPGYIARSALDRIASGPIWVADDIAEGVAAVAAMAPAERATLTAGLAARFAKRAMPAGDGAQD